MNEMRMIREYVSLIISAMPQQKGIEVIYEMMK